MHEIKIDNQRCKLCNSNNTTSKAVFNGKEYKIVTKCYNSKCISNNLDTHTPISSGINANGNVY